MFFLGGAGKNSFFTGTKKKKKLMARVIYETSATHLSLSRVRRRGPSCCQLVVDGEVVRRDALGDLHASELTVHVRGGVAIPRVPRSAYTAEAADVVADFLLRSDETRALQCSSVAEELAKAVEDWALALRPRWRWCTPLQLASVAIEGQGLRDAFARLYDANALLKVALRRPPPSVSLATWSLLKRLQPTGEMRSSWQGAALCALGVCRVAELLLPMERVARLARCGCFPPGCAAKNGLLLLPHRGDWALILGNDATVTDVAVGLAQLLGGRVPALSASPPPCPVHELRYGTLQYDPCAALSPGEVLEPWELAACTDTAILLRRAPPERWPPSLPAASAVAEVQCELLDRAVPPAPAEGEGAFARAHPHLLRRLGTAPRGSLEASLDEVRARALASQWRPEGIDTGSDLSSLGHSVLFLLCSVYVTGVQAAVYVSPARAACIGVRVRGETRLLDPSRMHLSPFAMAAARGVHRSAPRPTLRHGALPLSVEEPKAGMVYEYWCRGSWRLLTIVQVRRRTNVVHARYVLSGKRAVLSLETDVLRRASRDIQRMVKRKNRV